MTDNKKHIMLDIETLGVGRHPVITNIGAVKFDAAAPLGEFISTFDVDVSITSCLDSGRRIDESTLNWWLDQPGFMTMMAKQKSALDTRNAIEAFRSWYGDEACYVWGDGADFDNSIVSGLFADYGQTAPWSYRDSRCFRTFKFLFAIKDTSVLPKYEEHTGLGDAKWQADYMKHVFAENQKQTRLVQASFAASEKLRAAAREPAPIDNGETTIGYGH